MVENPMSNAANIADYRNLFRDDAAFSQFIALIRNAFQHDFFAFFMGSELLGSALSPGATRQALCEKMAKRMLSRPELVSELVQRLNDDDIVD